MSSDAPQPRRRVDRVRVAAAAVTILVAVLLAAAAIGWRTEDTAESKAYVAEPLYGVWGGLILLQMVGLAALGLASYVWWQELRTLAAPPSPQGLRQAIGHWVITAVLLGAALLAPAISMPDHYPRTYPDHFTWRVTVLGTFGVAAMAFTAAALVRIRTVVQSLPAADGAAAERFRYLWERQRQLLGALGAMLAIYVLATATKFQMNNHFTVPKDSTVRNLPDVPSAYVLVFGAIYGAVILAVYLPVYFTTRQVGDQLAARFASISAADTAEEWMKASAEQEKYRSALGVAEGVREHLERTTGILAPLITALFAALLPQLKL